MLVIGPNRLLPLIANSEWEAAIHCLQTKPSYARRWSTAPSLTGSATSEILPIHQACANPEVNVHFLEALLFANPTSIRLRESGTGRVALHVAIRAGVSDEVIMFLLTRFQDACSIQDVYGRLPLHYAYSNNSTLNVIESLIALYPESARAWDNNGWCCLHVACFKSTDMKMVQTILHSAPEICLMRTNLGNTPLDCAKSNGFLDKDRLVSMIRRQQEKFECTPMFQNMKEAESDEEKYSLNFKPTFIRGRACSAVNKKVRSRSIRAVV